MKSKDAPRNNTMNDHPEYTYLPSIVLFAAFIFFTTASCVFLYLSTMVWK